MLAEDTWIRLFLLACRKFVRLPDAVLSVAYRFTRLFCWFTRVCEVTVRSFSALSRFGAAWL